MQQTGFSLAATTGTALRIVVVTSSLGPSVASSGPGVAHDPAQGQDMTARDVAREVLDVLVCRRADELLGRSELDDRPVAHDRDPVSQTESLREIVRDEHRRLADLLLESHDLVLHVTPDERVESAERLVVEHHLRVAREGARDADALLHAARQLVGELVRGVLEPHQAQHLLRTLVPFALAHSLDLEAEGDVVDHAAMREQAEVLEDHRDGVAAQLPQLRAVGLHDVMTGDLDAPRRRLDQADERPHERRLAGAGEAHDDEHLSRPDLERDVADGDDAPRLLAQLTARKIGVRGSDEPFGVRAEDLPDALGANDGCARAIDPMPRFSRSSLAVCRSCRSSLAVSVMRASLIYHSASLVSTWRHTTARQLPGRLRTPGHAPFARLARRPP